MSLFRREARVFVPTADSNQIPQNSDMSWLSSRRIDAPTALHHWPVWACVRKIADTISSLPLDLIVNGEPVEVLPSKLMTPAAYVTMNQWLDQAMMSLLFSGNVYGLVSNSDARGYPIQVDLLDPVRVTAKREAGRRVFIVDGSPVPDGMIWHLPGPQLPGDLVGMAPLRYAARTVGLGLDAEQFATDFFRNGIHPSAVLESDQQITGDQALEMKLRVRQAQTARDAVVLGSGLALKPWAINAEESQFLQTLQHNAVAVAGVFGVPPEMIGASVGGSGLTYANREQRAQDFLNNAINPWLVRLEVALSAWFPRGQVVKFNTGALLRSDLKTRFDAYKIAIGGKPWMLPSEAREFENWTPVDGIDDGQPVPEMIGLGNGTA